MQGIAGIVLPVWPPFVSVGPDFGLICFADFSLLNLFERLIPLSLLTRELVFLVAITLARRVSELAVLSCENKVVLVFLST